MGLRRILTSSFLFNIVTLLYCINNAQSQTIIRGTVCDSKGVAVNSASVYLKDSSNKILKYCFSDSAGKYSLPAPQIGKFMLSVTALGFERCNIQISIIQNSLQIVTDVTLVEKLEKLEPITIRSVRPITVSGDKIIFDAASFAEGNEQVVEDLLRKIPGLTVLPDGTIKVGNREIEKLMVNNDDMFEKGYKLLSKNMPPNPIDKIELLQSYSNNSYLKGIENSNKVALNLTLKANIKRRWFGNVQGGLGIPRENRYHMVGNLMNFGTSSKYYLLTNLNNIGYDASGDINNLVRPQSSDDIGSVGDDEAAFTFLNADNSFVPNLKRKRVTFNNLELISFNSIFKISNKIKFKTLGFLNIDENNFYRTQLQSFSVGADRFQITEDFRGRLKQNTSFGKVDITYDISTNKRIEYTGKINTTNQRNISGLVFNSNVLNENVSSVNKLVDQKIVFSNKLNSRRVLLITGRYIDDAMPQNYTANNFIFSSLFPLNANNVAQFSNSRMRFLAVDAHFIMRQLNGNLFEIKAGSNLRVDNLNSFLQLKNDALILEEPAAYKNRINYQVNDLFLTGKYRKSLKKLNIFSEVGIHQLFIKLQTSNTLKQQAPFFINSKIGFDTRISSKSNLIASYSTNTTNTQIVDVYENFILTGFRSFEKGTNSINQLQASTAALNYTYGNWGDKFFASISTVYTRNHDFISTNSILNVNFSQAERIIVKGRDFMSVTSSVDSYFKAIRSNLKSTLAVTESNFKNIVNGSNLRLVKNNNMSVGFEMRSVFKGMFNYHIGTKWSFNRVTVNPTSNSFIDNSTFFDFSIRPNPKFNFQIQSERYYFGGLNQGNNVYFFLDLEGRYTIKENKLLLYVSGNNLLNTSTFTNYSVTDISVSTTTFRLMPAYLLLKAEIRF